MTRASISGKAAARSLYNLSQATLLCTWPAVTSTPKTNPLLSQAELAMRAVCTENFLQKFYEVCCKSGLIFCGKLHLTKRTVPSSYLLWAGQWKVLRSATGIPASSDFASRHSCGAIENLRHFPFAYTAEQSHPPPTAGP